MEIYVQPDKLKDCAKSCGEMKNSVANIESSFIHLTSSLSWRVKSKAGIDRIIKNLRTRLDNAEDTLYNYKDFFNDSAEGYEAAEKYEQQESQNLKNDLYQGKSSYNWTGSSSGSSSGSGSTGSSGNSSVTSGDSTESSTDSSSAESADDEGNWYDDLQTILEKFLTKSLSESAKTLSEFMSTFGKYAVGLSFLSGITSIGLKIKNFYTKYTDGVDSYGALFLDTISTGLSNFKTWTETVLTLDSYLKSLKGVKALEDTSLQNFCSYVSVIKVPLDFTKSYLEGYAEYSEDGEFTHTDFAATLIDSSISGLYSVINGFVDKIPGIGPALNAALDSANDIVDIDGAISDTVKDWASDLAVRANDGSSSLSAVETVTYNTLYGIGWAADSVLTFGENVVTGAKSILSSIFN